MELCGREHEGCRAEQKRRVSKGPGSRESLTGKVLRQGGQRDGEVGALLQGRSGAASSGDRTS